MTGGLLQLVAYGAQDIYLTGHPQITFFKAVYKRHTNFSIESTQQIFNDDVEFGQKITCILGRNGDLINKIYLEVLIDSFEIPQSETATGTFTTVPLGPISKGSVAKTAFMNKLGHGMIKYVECVIGGQLIERQYGEWMEIWSQLTKHNYGEKHFNYLVTTDAFCVDDQIGNSLRLFIPLQLWFCKNPGLALPLIALQYHEVKINIYLEELKNLVRFDTQAGIPSIPSNDFPPPSLAQEFASHSFVYTRYSSEIHAPVQDNKARKYLKNNWNRFGIKSMSLYVDYIYLDTDERRRFAQISHEYLITQVQYSGNNAVSKNIIDINIELDLNHPVKELIWIIENTPCLTENETNQSYLGLIPTCRVDPADRFTWLNNSGTSAILNTGYLDEMGNQDQVDQVYTYISTPVFGGSKRRHAGPNVYNTSENEVFSLITRPKSVALFWDQLDSGILQLNGSDRFPRRSGNYFKLVQTYDHHSGYDMAINNIYCYSFALTPEEDIPSGSCNFSRIDSASLNLKLYQSIIGTKNYVFGNQEDNTDKDNCYGIAVDRNIRIYATNYNILRIMSGMGGLAYSN